MGYYFEPHKDRIMVTLIEQSKTPGGILLPDSSKTVTCLAKVIYTNPEDKWIQPGDEVLVTRVAGVDTGIMHGKDPIKLYQLDHVICRRSVTVEEK